MPWIRDRYRALHALLHGERVERDVAEEFEHHIAMRVEQNIAAGMSAADARAEAMRRFGDIESFRAETGQIDAETHRARRRAEWFDALARDTRHAVRGLVRTPAFTATAVVTLALGIGANTAIFSVINGVLLRPLPFPHPEQLVRVWTASRSAGLPRAAVSAVDLDDWRAQRSKLDDIGGYMYRDGESGIDYTGGGDPQRLAVAYITPGFFPTLGIGPGTGRLPREDEMVRGGNDRVVVLSYGFWQRQFGGSPDAVGKKITLAGEPYEVIGTMPVTFTFPSERAEVWIPYSTIPDNAIPRIRPVRSLAAIARMKPGVTLAEAQVEMRVITGRLAVQYPAEDGTWDDATVLSLRDSITGNVRASLFVLGGAVAFVLLMACVNVASLLLARATARRREIAVRLALGAGRGRIVRQLLTESLVLAAAGGVAGTALAPLGIRALLALSVGQLPRGSDVRVDGTVLAFAVIVSALTGILFGLAPAVRASSPQLQRSLREGARGATGGGARLRSGLVIAEVALAAMLAVGAGLMTKSFTRLVRVDTGFRPDHLIAVMFTINSVQHPSYGDYYQALIAKVRTLPGVTAAGAVRDAPFRGEGEGWSFLPDGMVLPAGAQRPTAQTMFISDGYLHTIGAPMIAGREFTPQDRPGTGLRPMVINETMARRYFPAGHAVGATFGIWDKTCCEVIGVVGDIRQSALDEPPAPTMYVDNLFDGRVKTTLVARTQGDPLAMAHVIRDAIWSVDRDQTITSIFTFDDSVRESVARPRLLTVLLVAFGALGLVLGALGIYGVLAYLVTQRRREIGVRLALGARTAQVLTMIVRRGMGLALAGIALGLAGAFALARLMRTVLFGVAPGDPATFIGMAVVILGVAALASYLPARRAAAVDPAVTLRDE